MSISLNSNAEARTDAHLDLDLPVDHRRAPGQRTYRESALSVAARPDLLRRITTLAGQESLSESSIYLAGYAILLSRCANSPDISVYTASLTARRHDFHPGVVQTSCSPELNVREFLRAVDKAVSAIDRTSVRGSAPQRGASFCHTGFLWDGRPYDHALSALSRLTDITPAYERFDISLQVRSRKDTTELVLVYRSDLFEPDTVDYMARQLLCLVEDVVNRPDMSIGALNALGTEERALILGLYSGHNAEYPYLCLHQLFAEQAALRPDAEALVFDEERLTYCQLDQRSNQVAQFLTTEGICPEDRVGIFMNRSADMIVAMLGILKAGGAYVPIDPDYPAERLQFIAEDTGVRWVLTQHSVRSILPAAAPSIFVDADDSPIHLCSTEPVPNRSNPESIAVVIYTSGSTGKPKGACIPHRAAVRTVRNQNYLQVVPGDRITQAGSPSFDAAIQEIWLALANGATLVGLRRETLLDPTELKQVLERERISVMVLNTSYVHQIGRDTPEIMKGVRRIMFGGEAAEPGPLRALLEQVGPGVLVNGYGPAEGCVMTTYYEITDLPSDAVTVPIGRPISNAQVYVLDPLQRLVPIGMQGEIYIGGEGVARGYLNRPELTEQRFVPDPFSGRPDRVLYRTGDLARMRPDGQLEFCGRADEQVKIRGHRIELAEVRQAVASHPEVKQVFLMVREDQPGDKRLVAYITLQHPLLAAQDSLRQHTKEKLPAHMMPSAFVIVDSIPLNTNGKVDRKALPPPNERPELEKEYQAPQTELERKLTRVWQDLLRVDHIGIDDNFFDLGGHSLLAARLVARIEKQIGDNIPVATLFESPTIAQLAKRLKQRNYASAWSPLVELRVPEEKNITAPPFFCVHSLGANLVSFYRIASLMGGNRAIYGLQPHGLDGAREPLDSIEAMATAYLEEVRKKQPRGPYYLGGVCIGGVVAYEMAQQLRAVGEEVEIVALIDSFLPGQPKYLHSRPALTHYVDWHVGEMLLLKGMRRINYLARWIANGGVRLKRSLGWGESSSLARATGKVAVAHRHAIFAYRGKPYAGKVAQLMCSDASHRAYEDTRLAWSSLVSEGFEIRIIPGNHLTMVEEPHVRVVAQELQRCLDRASYATSAGTSRKGDKETSPRDRYQAA